MKITEITEATPTTKIGQTKPPMQYKQSGVGGGRGSVTSKVINPDGTRTVSSQITGNTVNRGIDTTTTNRAGQVIQRQGPRVGGIQQTTDIDPATGKETTTTNYRGRVGGAKVNVTAPGTADQFDLDQAMKTQVDVGGFTATNTKGGPTTAKMRMGPNTVGLSSDNLDQATVTRQLPGQKKRQITIPTSQLTGQK
jgi:hypothetical protein